MWVERSHVFTAQYVLGLQQSIISAVLVLYTAKGVPASTLASISLSLWLKPLGVLLSPLVDSTLSVQRWKVIGQVCGAVSFYLLSIAMEVAENEGVESHVGLLTGAFALLVMSSALSNAVESGYAVALRQFGLLSAAEVSKLQTVGIVCGSFSGDTLLLQLATPVLFQTVFGVEFSLPLFAFCRLFSLVMLCEALVMCFTLSHMSQRRTAELSPATFLNKYRTVLRLPDARVFFSSLVWFDAPYIGTLVLVKHTLIHSQSIGPSAIGTYAMVAAAPTVLLAAWVSRPVTDDNCLHFVLLMGRWRLAANACLVAVAFSAHRFAALHDYLHHAMLTANFAVLAGLQIGQALSLWTFIPQSASPANGATVSSCVQLCQSLDNAWPQHAFLAFSAALNSPRVDGDFAACILCLVLCSVWLRVYRRVYSRFDECKEGFPVKEHDQ